MDCPTRFSLAFLTEVAMGIQYLKLIIDAKQVTLLVQVIEVTFKFRVLMVQKLKLCFMSEFDANMNGRKQ